MIMVYLLKTYVNYKTIKTFITELKLVNRTVSYIKFS